MNLTEEELKAIEREAKDKYYVGQRQTAQQNAYISGATAERIKAKKLLEALMKIRYDWGLTSSEWKAHIAEKAINEYNKNS